MGESQANPPEIIDMRLMEPTPGSDAYHLEGTVSDPDGDLDQVKVQVWQIVGGNKVMVDVPQPDESYIQEYERRMFLPLVRPVDRGDMIVHEPVTGPAIGYRVTATDGSGLQADTGPISWSRETGSVPEKTLLPSGADADECTGTSPP